MYTPAVCITQKNDIRRSDGDEQAPTAAAHAEEADKDLPNDVITSYAGDTEHRKQDFFSFEDSFAGTTTTTESSDDYFSHDRESVDRLSLDGDLKSPLDDFDPFSF